MGGEAVAKKGERSGDFLGGKYLLESLLGVGGMGEVYRATNVSLGRSVAIKLLSREMVNNEDDVLRFLREARAAAAVRHPNVVDVLDVARDDDGTPFIVQELLGGEDLEQYLHTSGGRLSVAEALEIIIPVAEAVGAAHRREVVHRDLKPANIFLSREGSRLTPKVLDFGACLFPTLGGMSPKELRMLIGTPHYMAPEQITSRGGVDARADVWALGVILHELLVGETPFEAENVNEVLKLVRTKNVPALRDVAPNAPADLEAVVARCTERDREKRFSDATALAKELEIVRDALKASTRLRIETIPDTDGLPVPPPVSRRGALMTLNAPFATDPPPSSPAVLSPRMPPASVQRPIEAAAPVAPPHSPRKVGMPLPEMSLDAGTELDLDLDLTGPPSRRGSSAPPSPSPRPGSSADLSAAARRSSAPPSARGSDSLPPVLDPRAARASQVSVPAFNPMSNPGMLAQPIEPTPASLPSVPPASAPLPPSRPNPRASGVQFAATADDEPRPMTGTDRLRFAALALLPGVVVFGVLRVLGFLLAPVGRALRGDDSLASGILAVLTLVAATTLGARSLGASRTKESMVGAAGALFMGIVMIIVTFNAEEAGSLGIAPAGASLVPWIAPIAPIALAIAMARNARRHWGQPDDAEAKRSALLASLLVLVALVLGPVGAVRAGQAPPPPAQATPSP